LRNFPMECGRVWRFIIAEKVLHKNKMSTAVGDEGGFAPDLKDNEDALKVIGEAVEAAGYKFGKQVFVALDPRPANCGTRRRRVTSSSRAIRIAC